METQSKNPPIETIEITNFSGRLTRVLNGELNSGFAKFATSFGYDFFSKPGNLTWLEQPSDITGPILGIPLAAKTRYIGETQNSVYLVTSTGKMYQMWVSNMPGNGTNPIVNSVVGISSVAASSPTFVYGASMDFFGSTEKIYVGSDTAVNAINFNGSGDVNVGVLNFTGYHPLKKFVGKLLIGDGQAVSSIDNTNTLQTSVFGALPTESRVRDIDISPDGNYALTSSTTNDYEPISTIQEQTLGAIPSDGTIFYWNGSDLSITGQNSMPGSQITALQTYLQKNMFFITDSMGSALSDGTNKILTLPNNKAPFPNATGTNGDFLYWIAPEKVPLDPAGGDNTPNLYASMYYYGSIDSETPPGLYRVLRKASAIGGNILQTPLNLLTSTSYSDINSSKSSIVTVGYGQHYFSTIDVSSSSSVFSLNSFCFPPSGLQSPQIGVYETQTQLFAKKITVKQIRVYTEPTVANNSFRLYLVGTDGLLIPNTLKTYTFAAGTDITKLQGSLERIDFNPAAKDIFGFGINITNFGSVNMTIKKIEVDYVEAGK